MSFEEKFNEFIPELTRALSTPENSDWSVKGFIDCYKNIYSISTDTKVVSKIMELMIFPKFLQFARDNGLTLKLAPHQNYYPDITFIDNNGLKYAVDLKSTYRVNNTTVNGMTLGAFTGYFRNRTSGKNILFPYDEYAKHYVFGIIYSRTDISNVEDYLLGKDFELTNPQRKLLITYMNETTDDKWNTFVLKCNSSIALTEEDRNMINSFFIDETNVYNLQNFSTIQSVVKDFDFFLQEKWKIAIDRPGSGNTKNIGSENNITTLKNGSGLFFQEYSNRGKEKFDSFWMNYQTKDMARSDGRDSPLYTNITTYKEWVRSLHS